MIIKGVLFGRGIFDSLFLLCLISGFLPIWLVRLKLLGLDAYFLIYLDAKLTYILKWRKRNIRHSVRECHCILETIETDLKY